MKRYLTTTHRYQVSMIAGMTAGCGFPIAITCVTAIIELLH